MFADSLLKKIQNSYKGIKQGREDFDTTLHATDLLEFCPRAFILSKMHEKPMKRIRYLGMGEALTYEIGNKIQEIAALHLHKGGVLVGTWYCRSCRQQFFGEYDREKFCHKCSSQSWGHKDTSLKYHLHKKVYLRGGVDMFGCFPDGKYMIIPPVEIKSMKPDKNGFGGFESLQQPLPEHERQLKIYLWLMSQKETIDALRKQLPKTIRKKKIKFANQGILVYICKTFHSEPYKVFDVVRHAPYERVLKKEIAKVVQALKTGHLPDRLCADALAPMAKACNHFENCFQ